MKSEHSATATAGDEGHGRRDRLALLKARRQSLAEEKPELVIGSNQDTAQGAPGASARAGAAGAGAAAGFGAGAFPGGARMGGRANAAGMQAIRAKLAGKVLHLLTQTPADENGYVAGTRFTHAGLARLVEMLRKRAEGAEDGQAGGKGAKAVLAYLAARDGEPATPQGLSLARIGQLAQKAEGMRAARGGAGGGGGAAMAAGRGRGQGGGAGLRGGAARGAGSGGGGQRGQVQRQMMQRARQILTETADDGSGLVAGTPFTMAGVARLMQMLNERAADGQAQSARMAGKVLDMVRAPAGEEAVHGASIAKLRSLAQRLERGF